MKMILFQRLGLGAVLLFAVPAWAQAPASPTPSSMPGETPAASPSVAPVEPASLIPPNSLPGPGAASLPQMPAAQELQQLNDYFKQTSLGKAADEHRLHVQMAELETQIRNDKDLHELERAALQVRTDLERRRGLRAYYQLYYRKLRDRATTPELRNYLSAQAARHELTLLQTRVRHETDEAEAARLARGKADTEAIPLPTPVQAKVNNIYRP